MNSKRIKFANEFCFSAKMDHAKFLIGLGLVDYQLLQGELLVATNQNNFARVEIAAEVDEVIFELGTSYKRSLLRVDKIEEDYVSFTLLKFSEAIDYNEDNPLCIIIDQAITSELRANDIELDKAVEEVQKQILVKESGCFAFAYSTRNNNESLEIVGDRYSFTITQTPQKYLHITQIRKRSNRNRIDFPIAMLSGSIEIVNELTDRAILTARANEQYAKLIHSDAEFIELWNIYNELEYESIKQQAEEMGVIKYKSFRYSNGMIVFSVDGGYTRREFCSDNMYYAVISNINIENPMDYNPRAATIIGTELDYSCINTPEFVIKEEMDTSRTIPPKGYIVPSIAGSAIQKKRRETAEKNILANKCQMPGLKNIIQGGAQVGVVGRHYQPVSVSLEKEIFEGADLHFTEKQKLAIDTAINTPDIAIIQGPPGTGKTTVIRAIVKRLAELWNSKAKILITSTQHDAVDNAVESIDYGGLPVNRVSARKGKEYESMIIYDWIDTMISSCENWLNEKGGSSRGTVRNVFEKLARVEDSDDLKEKQELLTQCLSQIRLLGLSAELINQYTKVLSALEAKNIADESNEESKVAFLINSQRLTKEAFLDDGISQLKQLEMFLKFDSDLNFEIPDYWKKLKRITNDCKELDEYLLLLRDDCDRIEAMFPELNSVNAELLDKDIKDLIRAIRIEVIALSENEKHAVENLIWEFKQELTNSTNVDQLVRAYSKINAATCQQAANPFLSASMAGFAEKYDFVIVDEAARSNPLDLLIPMSMGKKIILVGDHKQLPHMVEKDVVQAVQKKTTKYDVASVLEESLFMRLNAAISKEDLKLGITRTAMLSEQYRMHPDICDLVNIFYDGKLETLCKAKDREHHLGLYDNRAVVWIDMPLSDKYLAEHKKQSITRQCEVDRIKEELARILPRNDKYKIGIITFYSAQAKLLNDMVRSEFPSDIDRIHVGTVDSFQGKEFDVVLLSIVRSNEETEMKKRVGFLNNDNRLCVAFSRAKRLLIAIGDSKTVAFDGEKEYVRALHEMYKKCHSFTGE